MRSLTLLSILILSATVGSAQQDTSRTNHNPKSILKFSPQHLLSDYPTLQFGLEYQFSNRYALVLDAGPSIKIDNVAKFYHQHGYKFKIELRRYVNTTLKRWRFYYGPELFYNHINYRESGKFGVNCADGLCDDYQEKEFGMHYRERGINFKSGTVVKMHRFCMDIHMGFAIRNIRYTAIDKPEGELSPDEGDDFFLDTVTKETSRVGISPAVGIRIGYILK